jgi:serine/threonine protein phosphatase PrpC
VLENFSGLSTHAWMAVFDGHGPAGGDCSRYAAKKLPTLFSDRIGEVRRQKSARSSHSEPTITSSDNGNEVASHPVLTPEECQSCIHQSFVETNQAMHRSIMVEDQLSGTTAIGVLFHDNHMTIANCGDSRAILGRKREHSDAPIKLSLIDAINGTTSIIHEEEKPDPPDSDPESSASIQEEKPDQNPSNSASNCGTEPELLLDDEPPRIEPVKPVVVNEIPNAMVKDVLSATVEEISRDTNKEPSSAIDETGSQDHPFDERKPRIESPVPPSESPRQASPDPANNDSPETNVDIQDGPFDEAPLQTKVPLECLGVTKSTNKDEENGTETIPTTKSSNDAMEAVQTDPDACIQEGDGTAESVTDAESMAATTAPSFMALPLSRDQTPWRKDERERVKAAGACVWSIDQVEGREPFHDDWGDAFEGDKVVDYTLDPPRLWIAGKEYPGTAFTRSIGDWLAESIGVIADPEMMTLELTGNDQIVVIASDGVFEFMTNQEVIDLCAQCSNPLEACEKVVQAAYQQWLVYENRTDDISVIVCFLRCSRPPIEGESGTTDELADALSSSDLNMSGASAQKMRYSRGISIVQSSNGLSPASIADALSQLSRDAPHALIEEEEGSC